MKVSTRCLLSLKLVIILCTAISTLQAQVQTARSTVLNSNCRGYYEYLPEGYNSGNEKYPLILFLHGSGEVGNGTTQLSRVLANGVPRVINDGKFPTSFTVNGQKFKFIVISPQFVSWPKDADITTILDIMISKYRIDISRIYLSGLSMGGGETWYYAANVASVNKHLAAIVPVCGANYPDGGRASRIADAKLPVWALHNSGDPTVTVSYSINYIANILKRDPAHIAKLTVFNASGHDAWTKAYDPNYREDGKNIYEWMLQFRQGDASAPPPVNTAPVANAGSDVSINLPTQSVQLNGGSSKDADGSIKSYSWTKLSGPTQYTLSSVSISNPVLSNLAQGDYSFRLTVTDDKGATGSDDVVIKVNAAPVNKSPIANAGSDVSINLPTQSVQLNGSNSNDADGSVKSYSWTKLSGPTQYTLSSVSISNPVLSNLAQGDYSFRLTVTDDKGATGSDDVVIKVNAAPANKSPIANAGVDVAITLPVNVLTLNGGSSSDPDGTIKTYNWAKISGPAGFTISNSVIMNPSLSNLTEGSYTLRLTVTDNLGATSSDEVVIKVNPAPVVSGKTIPGRIEAEQYNSMLGVKTEKTYDTDGTVDVSWLHPGDWLKYNVNVTATGTYSVKFRVSSPDGGSQFQIKSGTGAVLANVTIPKTGNYQLWTTVAASIALIKGQQTLQISSVTNGWNFNWLDFNLTGSETGAGDIGTTKTINIKLYGGTNPYSSSQWNNWNVKTAAGTAASLNIQSSAFKYSDGSASTVKAFLTHSQDVADNGASYGQGMAPAEVLRHSSYSSINRKLTISGLIPSKTYEIKLYSSRSGSGNSTAFVVNGVSKTIASSNNKTLSADFTNLRSDAAGNISVSIQKTNVFNYLNGLTITESSSASALKMASFEEPVTETAITSNVIITDPVNKFQVYPNPATNQVYLKLSNDHTGPLSIQVYDIKGQIKAEYRLQKAQKEFTQPILLTNLPSGNYILKVQIGTWTDSQKIIKL